MMRAVIVTAVVGMAAALMSGSVGAQSGSAPSPPTTVRPGFVDADGDGVCDNCGGSPKGQGQKVRKGGYGPGDGTGNRGVGPRDGSGYGRGTPGCTGSGPRGRGRGRR
jgi:hypothetical protein